MAAKIPEMVERVARAIGQAEYKDNEAPEPWPQAYSTAEVANHIRQARKAIAAMREPTEWQIGTPEGNAIMTMRRPSYIAVCRQTNCADRGYDEFGDRNCAWCADIADDIIETHSKAVIDAALGQ